MREEHLLLLRVCCGSVGQLQYVTVQPCCRMSQLAITFKVRVITNKKVDIKRWKLNYRNCCVVPDGTTSFF